MSGTIIENDPSSHAAKAIEAHTIDPIPDNERHGRVRGQFLLWFNVNAELFAFVLGGFAIAFGLNIFWALIAIVLGTSLGALFTSLHAVQGPRLGVPQMIQSRGQFGFYGASFIFLAAILLDVGYLAAQQVVQGQALNQMDSSLSIPVWIVIVTVPAVVLAIFGYDWIHRVQPVLTTLFIGTLIAGVLVVATSGASVAKGMLGFHLASVGPFIAVVGLMFMNILAWAPYVSDYSRYLPRDTSSKSIFWAVFVGNTIGFGGFAALGVYVSAMAPTQSNVAIVGSIAGKWILPLLAISLIGPDTLNAYTGMLTVESLRSTVQRVTASRLARVIGVLVMFGIATTLAETGYSSFITSFENFINVLLFFFVPWSIINLLDFYIVKRGKYDVQEFYRPRGLYGNVRWIAVIPYVLALGAQVPFLDQTLYVGPVVSMLGGADISWLVGFVVAGGSYLIATRIAGVRKLGLKPTVAIEAELPAHS